MKNFFSFAGLCALLTISLLSQAQNRYLPASIFKKTGDTLRGYVNSLHDPRQILFRTNKRHGREQKMSPSEVNSFVLGKESYVSRTVQFQVGDRKMSQLVFVQVLVSGQASLYSLTEGLARVRYYLEKDGKLIELRNYLPDALPDANGIVTPTEYEYITTLNTILNPAQPFNRNLKFRQDALIKVVYQANVSANAATARNSAGSNLNSIGIGVKYGENLSTITLQDYQGKTGMKRGNIFGAFVDIPLEGINRHLSLRCEALFSQKNTLVNYGDERLMNYIDFAAMMRYSSPKGLIRPYVGLGVISGATAAKRSSFLAYKPRNYTAGPLLEVGLQSRNAFFGIRAESLMRDTQLFQHVYSVSTGISF